MTIRQEGEGPSLPLLRRRTVMNRNCWLITIEAYKTPRGWLVTIPEQLCTDGRSTDILLQDEDFHELISEHGPYDESESETLV